MRENVIRIKEVNMKKLFLALALVSIVIIATGAVASAQDLNGSGALWAKGVGRAALNGNGTVHIEGHGVAVIHISGYESLSATGVGRRIQNPDGSVTFLGWKGQIHTSGSQLAVNIYGGLIEFKATGTGQATLQGRGDYRVCHRDPTTQPCANGNWSVGGATVTFGQ